MTLLERLARAEETARVLSFHGYQGSRSWCTELSYSQAFDDGKATHHSEKLEIVAVMGGIRSIRLSLKEAIAAVEGIKKVNIPSSLEAGTTGEINS